jgi:hypothetical protein
MHKSRGVRIYKIRGAMPANQNEEVVRKQHALFGTRRTQEDDQLLPPRGGWDDFARGTIAAARPALAILMEGLPQPWLAALEATISAPGLMM